ncbi:MAG: pentapeptide repeat-containing protein [Hyphomonadaceae bacterium]|nr:pentapeptide repeat-containing protein [Hyphomonadaceae bacterium]
MKRAALFVLLLALTTPAFAEAPAETGGPVTNQAERDAIAARVRGGASCARCDLFQIDLSYQAIAGRDFSGARLRQSELQVVTADRADFHGANLSLANLFGGRFSRANFVDVNFTGATLVGGYYGGARFAGAILDRANLSGSDLSSASGLTQAQLNQACGAAMTALPAGLTVPAC